MLEVTDDTNTSNGQVEVMVYPYPVVELEDFETVYTNTPAFELTGGTPVGGTYSGPGVDDGMFDAAVAGFGTHTITYTYEENACESFAEATIVVDNPVSIDEYVNGVSEFMVKLNVLQSSEVNLKVLNNMGVEVYAEKAVNVKNTWERNLNLSNFSEGIYFINIYNDETSILKKMVLRK
jgi:hypothetical protein